MGRSTQFVRNVIETEIRLDSEMLQQIHKWLTRSNFFRRARIFRATFRANLPSHRRPLAQSQPAWYVWSAARNGMQRSRNEEQ